MKFKLLFIFAMCAVGSLIARDVLVEFRGAYFKPTGDRFRDIYHGSGLYGGEIAVQLSECDEHWYGFFSIDYFSKEGRSIGLDTPTKVTLLPLGIGVKYFTSACWCDNTDFYVGLGFAPVRVHTRDESPDVIPSITKWALGGIAKGGVLINVSCDWFLDLFIGYSFARVSSNQDVAPTGPVFPLRSSVSGVIFGAGIGYRF